VTLDNEPFLKGRLRSIRIALDGIWQVITTQENARIHILATLVIWIVSFLLGLSRLEWVILLLVMGFVWAAEIFNTAIEELVDLVSLETTPEAKRIKDISAGAVLISAIVSILTGLFLFGPKLWVLIAR
jgi:diacylglycerol kinase